MNCSQARSLFSARLDNELEAAIAAGLTQHLRSCPSCSARWTSFEATVRMVRTLPQTSPDPSFVGQVLDRVRAYEAGRVQLEPVSESSPGWWSRFRERISDFGIPLPVPVRMAGALAIGVLAGILIAGPEMLLPGGQAGGPAYVQEAHNAAGVRTASVSAETGAGSNLTARPFGDLADELAFSPQGARGDSSEQDAILPGSLPVDPAGPSRQVVLDEANGRPQITF